jgi:photosystem II stability/assembly factor-like uncharacterized protein
VTRRSPWLLPALLALVLAGCGGGNEDQAGGASQDGPAAGWLDPDGEPPIVGSLAINPADDVLWMATNTGLFRVPDGAREPERLTGRLRASDGSQGDISEGLVVRFTGPDELLASGHPPPDTVELPDVLGLIESKDGGKTWTSVSELGTSDFHAIEQVGDVVVGSQFGQSQIMVSQDGGKTWETRTSPAVLVDLEVHPEDPSQWIATSAEGIFQSRDQGQTWRQVDIKPNSYLSWPGPEALYRIDPGGQIQVSADAGRSWEARGSTGGEPQALVAGEDERLDVLLLDGALKRSEDGGRTWATVLEPPAGA